MRIDKIDKNTIEITLSKRNLDALSEKLTWDSARTLCFSDSDMTLMVRAEPNDEHYKNRIESPGVMLNSEGRLY